MLVRRTPSTSQNRKAEPSLSLKMLVRPTGTTKNRPMASASAATIVPAHMPFEISSSSSPSWALAEMPSALKPMASDSTSATTPRMTGQRSTRWRLVHETSGNELTSISPRAASSRPNPSGRICSGRGLRTATAQVETPRIITPSSTACPPTGASFCAIRAPSGRRVSDMDRLGWLALVAAGAASGAALEALHAATRVDQLLLARVERVAVGADLHVDLGLGRARRELVAAGTADVSLDVLRMDVNLHRHHCRAGYQPSGGGAGARHGEAVVGLRALVDGPGGIDVDAQRRARRAGRPLDLGLGLLARGERGDPRGRERRPVDGHDDV